MAKISKEYVLRMGTAIRRAYPRSRRAARLTKRIKNQVRRLMKLGEGVDVRLHPELNELIWGRGATNPPRTLRVRAEYDDETDALTIFPAH